MKPKNRPNFKRIVSLAPAITEILFALRRSDRLVGVTDSCDYPKLVHAIPNVSLWFEPDLDKFEGKLGMGIISDTDPQPILFNSHMGRFAITTVCRMVNMAELEKYFLDKRSHFTENFQGNVNPTELVANLICEKDSFVEGIKNVHNKIKGSCSLLILTPDKIIAARDKLGRTPIVIGKKDGAFAVASETSSFPNTSLNSFIKAA